ncbi:beta-lactamase [Croceibacterium mercuriale]|uniref:Beta-lactamase n=1 Tax=Croceibacterium mercuriale TaxID=1572751 RepID=A0A0B2C0C1_9SPHN|nr:serine hydrolase domain-containing protein [Croceibacterium mercuriale]KHL25441.1 beta-lactamase [Croceibacterium mercuriale]
MATVELMLDRRALLARGAGAGALALLGGASTALLAQDAGSLGGLEQLAESYVAQRKVANMVIAIGQGQQPSAMIARGTLGFISRTPVDADTLYRIYSMTKPVTGMAAMMLVDDGRIALDQPVADILPAFARLQVQKQPDGEITPDNLEAAVRPLTMRHLLTHTGGLGYSIVQQGPLAAAYREKGLVPALVSRVQAPGNFAGTPAASLEIFADNLATVPLVHQPGERWSYSVGLDLMGRVIEVVTGMPFDRFLQERIFDPCGMASTGFQVRQEDIGRLTDNYLIAGETLVPIDLAANSIYLDQPPFPFGGAGLVSTPRDYDRFLQMIVGFGQIDGRRVMSEAAVRLATSDLLPDTLAADSGFNLDGKPAGFGAGGAVGRGAQAGLYGWSGAAGTFGFVHTGQGVRASLFSQFMPGGQYRLQGQFLAEVARSTGVPLG